MSVEPSLTEQKQEQVRVTEMDSRNSVLWVEAAELLRAAVYINN